MVKIEFECPDCKKVNNFVLMGNDKGLFERKCQYCKSELEIEKNSNEITVRSLKMIIREKVNKMKKSIPLDYKKYKPEKNNQKTARFIAFLILTSSVMGLYTGIETIYYFDRDYREEEDIKIEIVVKNSSNYLENAKISLDDEKINATYLGNGTYNVLAKPGKHSVKVASLFHKNSTMQIFIPPQENDLEWNGQGLDGVNRFTFEMQEGKGSIALRSTYSTIETWCPNLIILFSLIGIWGAWVTYTLQSYKNAQIGAFFSILSLGFFLIGPIIGLIALYYLQKNKKIFTAYFKN